MLLEGATVFHINVNCSDLARSLQFYRDGLGLIQGARTTPEAIQDGTAFGLSASLWDAWILLGDRGFDGGVVDLLEWKQPAPIGLPPQSLTETGWQRIGLMVADIDAVKVSVERFGGIAWSEPFDTGDVNGASSIKLCFVSDPDGVTIELIHAGLGPRVAFVGMTCANLERSIAFYESLGFREVLRIDAVRDDGEHLRIAGPVAMQEVLMNAPGGGDVALLLAGFVTPDVLVTPPRPANALGAWRAAMLVDDVEAVCGALRGADIDLMSDPVAMSMGPGLPDVRFMCFRGPDGEAVELVERPQR